MKRTGSVSSTRHPAASRSTESPTVYIIDDDESMRLSLDGLLRSVSLSTRMHASVDSFLRTAREDAPGCIILDVRLPGISGLEFQAQLSSLGIRLPVILMTAHGDIPMSVRGMKAGAVDFLTKPFRAQDMIDAVNLAIGRDTERRTVEGNSSALKLKFASLSPREQQVMQLVAAGKTNKQVARELGLSEITVKIHRGAAMRKMDAQTLTDLVRMAEDLKLPR